MTSKIKVDQIENTDGVGDVAFTGTGGISLSSVKLSTIKSSNGITAMSIDSSGRVATPVRPAFQCKKSSEQTATGNFETVTWDTPVLNAGGHFGSNKFTVPVAGLYVFNCTWLSTNDATAHDIVLAKTPSGGSSTALVRTRNATVTLHETVNLHYVGQFSVNDTVEIQIAGSGQKIYGDSGGADNYAWTTFMGYLLG